MPVYNPASILYKGPPRARKKCNTYWLATENIREVMLELFVLVRCQLGVVWSFGYKVLIMKSRLGQAQFQTLLPGQRHQKQQHQWQGVWTWCWRKFQKQFCAIYHLLPTIKRIVLHVILFRAWSSYTFSLVPTSIKHMSTT